MVQIEVCGCCPGICIADPEGLVCNCDCDNPDCGPAAPAIPGIPGIPPIVLPPIGLPPIVLPPPGDIIIPFEVQCF